MEIYKKILVTGGAGMIGSNITKRLSARGHELTILDDLSAYPFDYAHVFGSAHLPNTTLIQKSILDATALESAMTGVDAVIHAAAYADVGACVRNHDIDFEINVRGTDMVLESALKHGIKKLVFVSSASVYGENTTGVFTETDPAFPISTYGNSKLWGERQSVLFNDLYGMPTAAVRYFSVYGSPQVPKEGSHSWCVAIFAMLALKKKPITIFGDGSQVRDFTHVSDIADATIRALDRSEANGKIMNVGTGARTTIKTIAEKVTALCGNVPILYKPHPKGDPHGGHANTDLMKKVLDWSPKVSLDEGIEEYCTWIKNNQNLIPEWL